MKISYNWLKEFIELKESPEEIARLLTKSGLEVEGVDDYESLKGSLEGMVIGEVLTCEKHPGADKLKKTTVNIGTEVVPVVCGADNVAAGQKVVLATVGATLYPTAGEPFKISKAKIRGEVSEGMICAEDEIGIGTSHGGIIVLDTNLPAGTPASKYFNIETDHILEIGLTPNRADAASHFGVARDLKALLKRELKSKSAEGFKKDNNANPVQVSVESSACIRYSGLTISNVTVKESPDWLKHKLLSIGLSPINNIVDITNFILHDIGQPLHAFDLDKVDGKKIIVKTVAKGTEFVTLDKQKRKLNETDLMICSASAPMCVAGVFGGADSGVTSSTKNIFLESACFSADSVRKTSLAHGLKTDASFRFERGTDPNITVYALKKAALLIKELAGGELSSDITDIYPEPVKDFTIETSYTQICNLIGKAIEPATIKEILANLDIKLLSEQGDRLSLAVPPYRVDVQRPADIVEEVLRIYGYDNIEVKNTLSSAFLANFPEKDKEKMQNTISQFLAANGFSEIITNSLTKPVYAEKAEGINAAQSVEVLNKLSEDLGVLRQSLLFSGLEVLAHNINRKQADLKLFEFGKIYSHTGGAYSEKNRLSILITGDQWHESWNAPSEPADFYNLKTIVLAILSKLGIQNTESGLTDSGLLSEGLVIKLKPGKKHGKAEAILSVKPFDEEELVNFGLVKEQYTKLTDVKQKVWFADFDLDLLFKAYGKEIQFTEISKYPEVRRDLSLVLDKAITFEKISELAAKTERKLLKEVNVFDVYEGENIGKDKKSYSISFILEDMEQTLTDKVIDKTMEKLMDSFQKELGAVIRK